MNEATASQGPQRRSAENAALWERRFEKPLFIAALFVIPAIILTSVDVPAGWRTVGEVLNWATWGAFAVEFAVMMSVVPSRWRYLRDNPVDVIIVFFTFPKLTSVFTSLRALRLLRVLRLLRLKPVVTWMFSAGGVRYAGLFALLVAVAGGYAFSELEGGDAWNGFYWAVTTMTTVGYGKPEIMRTETEALAVILMLVGIGFVAVLTGALAERFLQGETRSIEAVGERAAEADEALLQRVDALASQVEELRAALLSRPVLEPEQTTG